MRTTVEGQVAGVSEKDVILVGDKIDMVSINNTARKTKWNECISLTQGTNVNVDNAINVLVENVASHKPITRDSRVSFAIPLSSEVPASYGYESDDG